MFLERETEAGLGGRRPVPLHRSGRVWLCDPGSSAAPRESQLVGAQAQAQASSVAVSPRDPIRAGVLGRAGPRRGRGRQRQPRWCVCAHWAARALPSSRDCAVPARLRPPSPGRALGAGGGGTVSHIARRPVCQVRILSETLSWDDGCFSKDEDGSPSLPGRSPLLARINQRHAD